ncbi:MAG: hypothetical protein HFG01_00130 [Oscillibacter sp.]|nr:hypothetical protein [Oscillibacter sp.]
MKQDAAEKIAQQTAKITAKAESDAAKKIAKAKKAAEKKTAAAAAKDAKKAAKAEKQAAKISKKVSVAEKKAAAKVAKVEKKAAAQSAKAAKLAAKRAPEKGAEGGEAQAAGKKGGKKKILLLLPLVAIAVAAGVFFFLKGKGGKEADKPLEPITAPVVYLFSEEIGVPALPVQDTVVVYEEKIPREQAPAADEAEGTEDAESSESAEGTEGAQEAEGAEEAEEVTVTRYTYEGVSDPKGLMAAYAVLMTQEDVGFSAIDAEMVRTDLPDFEGKEATEDAPASPPVTTVTLARNGDIDNEIVHSLLLEWDEDSCSVTVDTPSGRVRDPKPPASAPQAPGLTVEGFKQLNPAVLGLEGSSMEEYNVLVQDGLIMVYGSPCVRISAYSVNQQTGSNEIAGSYFLSADGQHVYRYDTESNSVEELEIEP